MAWMLNVAYQCPHRLSNCETTQQKEGRKHEQPNQIKCIKTFFLQNQFWYSWGRQYSQKKHVEIWEGKEHSIHSESVKHTTDPLAGKSLLAQLTFLGAFWGRTQKNTAIKSQKPVPPTHSDDALTIDFKRCRIQSI